MKKFLRIILPLLAIGAAVAVTRVLIETKPEAEERVKNDSGVLVEVVKGTKSSAPLVVRAKGTVVPARTVTISPEVMGRVVWQSPNMVKGGRFKANETMLRLDGRDFQLAVQQQFAAVDRARTELRIERSRQKVAEREWALFNKKPSAVAVAPSPENAPAPERLALREPQMRTATVAVKAAESGLLRARLSVGKTVLKAPFNAVVLQRQVEMGQLVGPNSPVATLVGTDAYIVQVSVPVEQLRWIDIPNTGGGEGAEVTVTQEVGGQAVQRQGRVLRLLSDVDTVGRMARVLVKVEDPLGLGLTPASESGSQLPLLLNSYVSVEIKGAKVDAVEIPRVGLRDGNRVFLMNPAGKLEIREVEVLWREEERVLVSSGLSTDDQLVVSPVPSPIEGMDLRLSKLRAETADGGGAARSAATPTGAVAAP